VHPHVATTADANKQPATDVYAQKTACDRIFEFITLFLGESSIHGFSHLVAKKRTFIER
jgi:hypothetical protein